MKYLKKGVLKYVKILVFNSKEFSLFPICKGILSWGRALGPLGGLSTRQLNCCLPRMKEKRETQRVSGTDLGLAFVSKEDILNI